MVITYLVTGMQNQVESTNPGDINVTLNGHSKWNHPPKKIQCRSTESCWDFPQIDLHWYPLLAFLFSWLP